jgi:hypothetical protein
MKKTGLFPILALLVSGCAKDGITDADLSASEAIGFTVAVTRTAENDLATMEGDGDGFRVWALSGEVPTGWYTDGTNAVDGTNPHRHDGVTWSFAAPVQWPQAMGYPMRFYALYPAAPAGLGEVSSAFSPAFTLRAGYTVPSAAAAQTDLLAAAQTADRKPVGSTLPLEFGHILSKVDFGIVAGAGIDVYVQSIEVVNAAETGVYDFVSGRWESPAAGNASYTYFGGTSGGAPLPTWPSQAIVADDETANPIYIGDEAATKHLMLMPQRTASWRPVGGTTPDPYAGGYVAVTYRTNTSAGSDGTEPVRRTGFIDAANHPDYDGSVRGPLYVKTGFPLIPDAEGNFVWEAGKSYRYNIGIGTPESSGGYILDEYYYDERGNRTNLRLIRVRDEGKLVGDPMRDGIIHMTLAMSDWNVSVKDIFQSWPRFSPDHVRLRQIAQRPARQSIQVLFPEDGTAVGQRPWTLTSADPSWLTLSLDPRGYGDAATIAGNGPRTVYLVSMANGTGNLRSTELYLDGDPSDIVATVGQNLTVEQIAGAGDLPPSGGPYTYVGAFWRHDQIGERVIRFTPDPGNRGAWSAEVVWMDSRWSEDDGVVLAAGGSRGSTVGTDELSVWDADAEHFPVAGDATFINGMTDAANPEVVFRIGLKSAYNPTVAHQVRYAVVMVTYGTKKQKLFLRQGEYDDYLMTRSDPVATGGIASRTKVVKFSPYNLTAATLYAPADVSGTVPAVNPGRFTEFPTQGGVFFQWASTDPDRQRMAWPIIGTATNWNASYSTDYWNTLAPAHETCPPGYRRPTDGSTTAAEYATSISNSEIRQSLWWQPQTGSFGSDKTNNIWGYYADGYFDRHPLVTTPWATLSAVNDNSREVGYIGTLFYNPVTESDHYNASLFFPAGGWRDAGGALTGSGRGGHYWTTSTRSADNAWILWIRNDWYVGMWEDQKSYGLYVRCVRNAP